MKFLLSVLVYLVLAFLFCWGIYDLMKPEGSPWLLVGTSAVYTVLAVKIGCMDAH